MKTWKIVINPRINAEIKKKITRLLRPVFDVRQPDKCYFCGTTTSWVINKKNVCPKCAVSYGFLDKQWLLDPCEVCGAQGEWSTDGDPQHFLCFKHRDEWFHWDNPELRHIDMRKEPEKWHRAWDKGWAEFVACMMLKGEG
jgi:hypothetical protein